MPSVAIRFGGITCPSDLYSKANLCDERLPRLFKSKLNSNDAVKCVTVTCYSLSNDISTLFMGFKNGFFEAFNALTLEHLPRYEPPAEPRPTNQISKIVNYAHNGFWVVCRNTITEYLGRNTKYEFKYHVLNRIRDIVKIKEKYYAIDIKGFFYDFLENVPHFEGSRRSLGTNREVMVKSMHEMGPYSQIIQVKTDDNKDLLLVRHNHCIALMDLVYFPDGKLTMVTLRIDLNGDPKKKMRFRCFGDYYFYATLPNYNKESEDLRKLPADSPDRSIYYNTLQSIGDGNPDGRLETISGQLKAFDIFGELLMVTTTTEHIEIIYLLSFERIYDIECSYVPKNSLIYRNSIVVITRDGFLLSRSLTPFETNCCYHCEHKFTAGDHKMICKHFLPRPPLTNEEIVYKFSNVRFA